MSLKSTIKKPFAVVVIIAATIIADVFGLFFLDTPEPSVWAEDTMPLKNRFVGFSDIVSAR